jgi:hypothetical protein
LRRYFEAYGAKYEGVFYHADQLIKSMYATFLEVGLCSLNQVDPYPITYSLSNP